MTLSDSSPRRRLPDRFLVAFSFAGEQRELVRAVAEAAEQRLGWGTVFYDEWFEADLAGSAGDLKLQRKYLEECEVVVFCPSTEYGKTEWTITEWDAIRARHMRLRADPERRAAERILPLRVADGDVEGLLDNALWVDARHRTAKYVADLIVHKLNKFVPAAGKPHVFLAETIAELDDPVKPVNRQRLRTFLDEQCGAVVLPTEPLIDLPPERYRRALEDDMQKSLAFVQLLSQYPWRGGGFDRAQHQSAVDFERLMLRFRGEIDLDQVDRSDPQHRRFLEADGSIAGGFEDYKQYLAEKLKVAHTDAAVRIRKLQEEELRSRTGGSRSDDSTAAAELPLVRVVVRAGPENNVWEPIFRILFERENILLDELAPGESFVDRHDTEPCHGFLILCDDRAQREENLSPRDVLAQCRLIQTRLKNSTCLPPVALVYWPPPDPVWSRLLRSIPRSLHRVLANSLETGLGEFLAQVRRARGASS